MPTRFDQRARIAIATKLWKLQRSNRIPCIWIECDRVYIQIDYTTRARLSWTGAQRLAAGEPLLDVIHATEWLKKFVAKQTRESRRMRRRHVWQLKRKKEHARA